MDEIQGMIRYLRDRGIGILITDHNVRETLGVTDRAYIMADGRIFRSGAANVLKHSAAALGHRLRAVRRPWSVVRCPLFVWSHSPLKMKRSSRETETTDY